MLKDKKFGTNYRKTCFKYHGSSCIICDEESAIHAHHIDEDRTNNHPENLIPLCPTHHAYMHNDNAYKIQSQISVYMKKWKKLWYEDDPVIIK